MENSNIKNEESNLFDCYICMDKPKNPVATPCGHIYCWRCLQSWVSGKSILQCPVCKNGLDMNRVIPLYTSSTSNQGEKDERPKVERIPPVRQSASVFNNIARSFGLYGVENSNNDQMNLPSQNEVKINQMAAFILIFGIFLIVSIFYLD